MLSLQDRCVIVTGGAQGIGRAIALAFAAEGAKVVVSDVRPVPEEVLEAVQTAGGEAFALQADVSNFGQARDLIAQAADRFDGVDVLVNNAGITKDNLLVRMPEEEFDRVIAVNLKGAFNTLRHVSPLMVKQRSGAIVNISSVVGIMGNPGQANYAASKAGIIGLTKTAAKELGGRGVTCNAVAPGYVMTEMTEKLPENVKTAMMGMIPLKRFAAPEEIADAVVFLARNRYITGEVLNVNGGMI